MTKFLFVVGIFVVLLCLVGICYSLNFWVASKYDLAIQLFGVVFSGLALIGLIAAIFLQQKELSQSTLEFRRSASALEKSNSEQQRAKILLSLSAKDRGEWVLGVSNAGLSTAKNIKLRVSDGVYVVTYGESVLGKSTKLYKLSDLPLFKTGGLELSPGMSIEYSIASETVVRLMEDKDYVDWNSMDIQVEYQSEQVGVTDRIGNENFGYSIVLYKELTVGVRSGGLLGSEDWAERMGRLLSTKDAIWQSIPESLNRLKDFGSHGAGSHYFAGADSVAEFFERAFVNYPTLYPGPTLPSGQAIHEFWFSNNLRYMELIPVFRGYFEVFRLVAELIAIADEDGRELGVYYVASRFQRSEAMVLFNLLPGLKSFHEKAYSLLIKSPLTKNLPGFYEFCMARIRPGCDDGGVSGAVVI